MEGNEKADELAKEGSSLDGGFLAEIRAQDVKKSKKRGLMRLLNKRPFHLPMWKSGICVKNT